MQHTTEICEHLGENALEMFFEVRLGQARNIKPKRPFCKIACRIEVMMGRKDLCPKIVLFTRISAIFM